MTSKAASRASVSVTASMTSAVQGRRNPRTKAAGHCRRLQSCHEKKIRRSSGRRLDRRDIHLVAGLGIAHRDFLPDLEVRELDALGSHVG